MLCKAVVLLVLLPVCFCGNFERFLLVRDLLKKYYVQPSTIIEFPCRKSDSFQLLKLLSRERVMASVFKGDFDHLQHILPPNSLVFLLDLNSANATLVLEECNKLNLFAAPYRWIITGWNGKKGQLKELFFKIKVLVDSAMVIATRNYVLTKIYKRSAASQLIFESFGTWAKASGLNVTEEEPITAKRRKNLVGTTLNTCIVITNNDTFNHLTDNRDKHIDTITKVNYVLVEHLSNIVNATLNYSVQPTWGYRDKSNKWSGMIGELTRKEAVIGGTALFLTTDRVSEIDYIAMTTPTKSKFVFRQPKLSYVTNVYTLPFHWTVWVSTIAFVVLTIIVLYFVVNWEWQKKIFHPVEDFSNQPELNPVWTDVSLSAFGALCQQSSSAIPYSVPGRIVTILMFVGLMFLYTSYSANIVALLQSSSNSIKTLNDLLHSRLSVGVDDTVFNHFYFPNASEPVRRALYLQKVIPPGQPPRYFPIAEGVRRMRVGLFAFHMETGAGYKIVSETFQEHEKCGLQEIGFLQVPDPWLAVQKNTSYKEMFKIGLRLIHESGLQPREVSLLYTKKPECTSRGSSFVSVGIIDCYAAAAVFAGGIFAAASVFIFETYLNYRMNTWKRWMRLRKH